MEPIESQPETSPETAVPDAAPPLPAEPPAPDPGELRARVVALLKLVAIRAQPGDPHGWYEVGQEAKAILEIVALVEG